MFEKRKNEIQQKRQFLMIFGENKYNLKIELLKLVNIN